MKMAFEDKPLDQAAHDETLRIYSDKTHPHHEGWKRGDKASIAYRDSLLQKAWGTGPMDSGDLGPNVEKILAESMGMKAPAAPGAPESSPPETLSPPEADAAFVDRETEQREAQQALDGLRQKWGSEFDQKAQALDTGAKYFGEKYPDIFQDVAFKDLGNDPRIIDAVVLLGERLRGK
jgi:hypothetical protein